MFELCLGVDLRAAVAGLRAAFDEVAACEVDLLTRPPGNFVHREATNGLHRETADRLHRLVDMAAR